MAQHAPVRLVSRSSCAGRALVARGAPVALVALVALVAPAPGAAAAAPERPDSGIRGLVLYGPTCPVQRAGQNCERPYQATIVVRREPSNRLVVRAHSGSDGRFTVRLRPGRYELKPSNGIPFPRASAQTVTVSAHHFISVSINFDSGIR
jgi:hypothetical protein